MPPVTFDTLATARNLEAAGIASAHAEAIALFYVSRFSSEFNALT